MYSRILLAQLVDEAHQVDHSTRQSHFNKNTNRIANRECDRRDRRPSCQRNELEFDGSLGNYSVARKTYIRVRVYKSLNDLYNLIRLHGLMSPAQVQKFPSPNKIITRSWTDLALYQVRKHAARSDILYELLESGSTWVWE